ncbi:MAG: PilN domain-containing protein [Burkholderiaceae bacterium]|nr:PilN domain-containing protein [Burkholderiaceae bacterium]
MILINLLPHREAARKRMRDAFYASLGVAAMLGGLLSGGVYLWYQTQISSQQSKNNFLTSEIKRLEGQIKEIANLQTEIAALRARQQAVEDLQSDRNLPVHLLNELVKQLPDGVYISSMRQENQNVTLSGVAQSNERVSEFLRNLAYSSVWLTKPDLVEIVAGNVALGPRDSRRVSNFTIRVRLRRASDLALQAAAAASAASGSAAIPAVAPASAPAKAAAKT